MKTKEQKRLEAALRILEGASFAMKGIDRLELDLAKIAGMDRQKAWSMWVEAEDQLDTFRRELKEALQEAVRLPVQWSDVKEAWDRKMPILSRHVPTLFPI